MATVTGTLQDFELESLNAFSPRIFFIPSGPGVKGSLVLASRPIPCTPNVYGELTVELASTDNILPEAWYTMTIEWQDSEGGFIRKDFPQWKIRVPMAGGNLVDMIDAPAPPWMVAFSSSPPLGGLPGSYWVDLDTGVVSIGA